MPNYQLKVVIREEKIDEFLRSVRSFWFQFLKEEGCLSYHVYREFENENSFLLVGDYGTLEAMNHHFQMQDFEVLLGATTVLGHSFKMNISENLETGGVDLAKSKFADHSYSPLNK